MAIYRLHARRFSSSFSKINFFGLSGECYQVLEKEFNKYLDILKEMPAIIYSTNVNMQVNGYIKFSVTLSPLERSFDF